MTASKKRHLFHTGFNEGAGHMDTRGGGQTVGGDWKLWRGRGENRRKDTEGESEKNHNTGDGMEDCNKKNGLDGKEQTEAVN